MEPLEPAGMERGEGKSAEPFFRARKRGGPVRKTYGTVCGKPQVRYPLTELDATGRACTVGRSVPLPTFYYVKVWRAQL